MPFPGRQHFSHNFRCLPAPPQLSRRLGLDALANSTSLLVQGARVTGQIHCPDDCLRALAAYWSDSDGLSDISDGACRCVAAPAMLRRAALLADAAKGAEALQRYLHDVLAPAAAAEGSCLHTLPPSRCSPAAPHPLPLRFAVDDALVAAPCSPHVPSSFHLIHKNGGRDGCRQLPHPG